MPADNKIEIVVEVYVNKANASIKSLNTGLSSMEQAAYKAARGAFAGIDGLTGQHREGHHRWWRRSAQVKTRRSIRSKQ